MSLINPSELGNMLIGAYVGEIMDIHEKNAAIIEEAAYPTVHDNCELTFATTREFSGSAQALYPSRNRKNIREHLSSTVTMSELVKTRLTTPQFMHFLQGLRDTKTLDVYGIIINLGRNRRINPLHPMVAQALASGKITLPEDFEVIVYPMTKSQKISQDDLETNVTAIVEVVNFLNVNSLLAIEKSKPKNSVFQDIRSLMQSPNPLNHTIEFQSDSEDIQNVLIPVQLASDGIMTPYYGILESKFDGSSYKTRQISPMLSGNTQGLQNWGSTCTGDLSSSRYSSLHVLNGFNINSAYFTDTVNNASYHWIKACQLVSIEILTTEPENVEETKEKE